MILEKKKQLFYYDLEEETIKMKQIYGDSQLNMFTSIGSI